jgi:hypothetical protein
MKFRPSEVDFLIIGAGAAGGVMEKRPPRPVSTSSSLNKGLTFESAISSKVHDASRSDKRPESAAGHL